MRMDIYYIIKNKLHTISTKNYITAYTSNYGVKYSKLGSPYVSHKEIIYTYPRGKFAQGDIYFPEQNLLLLGGTRQYRDFPYVLENDGKTGDNWVWEVSFPGRFLLKYIKFIVEDLGLECYYREEKLIPVVTPVKKIMKEYENKNKSLILTLHEDLLPPAYKVVIKEMVNLVNSISI